MTKGVSAMDKIGAVIGSILGGAAGWWIGSLVGDMTGVLLSIFGTAAGLYYGRRWAIAFLEG